MKRTRRTALAAVIALAIAIGLGAPLTMSTSEAQARSLAGPAILWTVIKERKTIDEFFGRAAALWYGVEFEGGALYGR